MFTKKEDKVEATFNLSCILHWISH